MHTRSLPSRARRIAAVPLCLLLAAALVAGALAPRPALAQDPAPLRQKQADQEQARQLAADLVASILDVQLRQLEENGLAYLPVHRDLTQMRGKLDQLVQTDMAAVVELLAVAQTAPPAEQPQLLARARQQIRDVVAQLLAERQRLSRRMQVAQLAADTQQLIHLQSKVVAAARLLAERKPDERERELLAAAEDQADVNRLYLPLLAALEDVSTWSGDVALAARDGLRILKAAQVQPALQEAGEALSAADIERAVARQQTVLRGLAALLERLEQAQGLAAGDREEALRRVRLLRAQQEDLARQTREHELVDPALEALVRQQTAIAKELGRLAEALQKSPGVEPLLEEAKAAAWEATAQLFEEKKPAALDQQRRVVASLSQMENVLEQGLDLAQAGKSADELAAELARLEAALAQLAAAAAQQTTAAQDTATPPAALAAQQQVVEGLARLAADEQLPASLRGRLQDAREAAERARSRLTDSAASTAERAQALAQSQTALSLADAEAHALTADTRRRHKAVVLGELTRAAEALERAAAASRSIARQVERPVPAAQAPEQAEALLARQVDLAAVAARIGAGVEQTAPAASQALRDLVPQLEANHSLLAAAAAPAKETPPRGAAASQAARQAAEAFAQAAAQLRQTASQAAGDLARIASQQLHQAESARRQVEEARDPSTAAGAARLAALAAQQRKLDAAYIEQLQAAGRTQEAAARQLASRFEQALAAQDEADDAAEDLARGRANSPLDAAARQQAVADLAEQIAQDSPANARPPLAQAARHAQAAASQLFAGNAAKGQAEQQAARQALEAAWKSAAARAEVAAADPSTASPGSVPVEPAELAKTREALARARQQFESELQKQPAEDSQSRAAQSARLAELAREAARIDPGATAALARARRLAEEHTAPGAAPAARAGSPPAASRQAARRRQDVDRSLEQAVASLTAREELLRRDRVLAESLLNSVNEQQTARDAIADAAADLERLAAEAAAPNEQARTAQPLAERQLAAALALDEAQQRFAAALRSAGQGAAEVSGQPEVANVPIREGLQIASRLSQPGGVPREGSSGAPGEPAASQPSATGQQSAGREGPAGNKSQAPGDASKQAQAGQPGEGAQAGDAAPADELGTGFVPASPEATAKQIAGEAASASAAQAMASAGQGQGQGQGQPGQGKGTPSEGQASSAASRGGAVKAGAASKNEEVAKGDLETAPPAEADSRGQASSHDAASAAGRLAAEAWFAKLPPGIQAAIQARARGKAPRGYEERLRRYFESVD